MRQAPLRADVCAERACRSSPRPLHETLASAPLSDVPVSTARGRSGGLINVLNVRDASRRTTFFETRSMRPSAQVASESDDGKLSGGGARER